MLDLEHWQKLGEEGRGRKGDISSLVWRGDGGSSGGVMVEVVEG